MHIHKRGFQKVDFITQYMDCKKGEELLTLPATKTNCSEFLQDYRDFVELDL